MSKKNSTRQDLFGAVTQHKRMLIDQRIDSNSYRYEAALLRAFIAFRQMLPILSPRNASIALYKYMRAFQTDQLLMSNCTSTFLGHLLLSIMEH